MKYHLLLASILVVALVGCRSTAAPASHAARLDQEIQLAPGERAAFDGEGLSVEFVRVVEDSRCPTDATCVWAGEVKVQLATRIGNAEASQHQITSGQPAVVGEFRLNVVRVLPERVSTRDVSSEEYRVILKVERASN
jgi:hypothetical protein